MRYARAVIPRTYTREALWARLRGRRVGEARDLAKLDLTPRGGAGGAEARRRAIFDWNVRDPSSPFYSTDTAKELRERDPEFGAAQAVWAMLYEKVQ